jgi:uncharacterized protein (DUF488 family)
MIEVGFLRKRRMQCTLHLGQVCTQCDPFDTVSRRQGGNGRAFSWQARKLKDSLMKKPLFTIGYEHATTRAMLDELAGAKVDLVIDVRAVTSSRRPGFSKNQLAAGLDERGIAYIHLRALGTPKEGRLAARAGKRDELFRIFEKHLKTPDARQELDELTALAKSGRRLCLLCYERDPEGCHRRRVAELIHERTGAKVEHLFCAPV